jgi:hypothetical protein
MGFWRTLDAIAGGKTITQARDEQAARALAQQRATQQAHLMGDIQGKLKKQDPMLAMLMQLNPEKASEALATHYQAANVAGGDTRYLGPTRNAYAPPKLVMDNGVTGTQTSTGTTWNSPRPVTAKEKVDMGNIGADNTRADADLQFRLQQAADLLGIRREELEALTKYRTEQQKIGWYNAKKPPSSGVSINVGGGGSGSSELPTGYSVRPRQ